MNTTTDTTMDTATSTDSTAKKVGLWGLVAIVIGAMVGAGVFGLPQNMASGAGLGAVIISWIITGLGMLFLAFTFQTLAIRKPDLNAGIYSYAKAGFGNFIGFNSAWGYWISAMLGNVSYAVLLMGALGYFFPIFGEGNTWQAIVAGSILTWVMNFIVLRGVGGATLLNLVTTIAKLIPIILFIIIVFFAMHWDQLTFDFWGTDPDLGGLGKQIASTMLVTLWVFIGIEGAVVISGRAKSKQDVRKATMIGFLGTLAVYAMVSIFSFGVMNQAQLAGLEDPSMAYVLEAVVGKWGAVLINTGVIISLLGGWLAWTILMAELPARASENGTMPQIFAQANKYQAPSASLWISSGIVQLFLIVTLFSNSTYKALYFVSSSMILVPYVFSALYLWKLAARGETYERDSKERRFGLISGIIGAIYGVWLVYAAGLGMLMMTAILYAPGIIFFWIARKENAAGEKVFTKVELAIAIVLVVLAIISIVLIAQGKFNPLG